jgi:phosphoribosylformylglycinamidine cyclo-ligase
MAKLTYKSAGLDLDVYEQSMARLPRLAHRTFSPRVLKLDGGFAGLFQLDFDSPLFARKYKEPVLVACTDGVGTKLKVAQMAGVHNTVGIDLVAMSVNDAICCGAEPLAFLDYLMMQKDEPDLVEQIVSGISDGCVEADCALIGGETAIHPDQLAPGDYDLAGFCIGVVEKSSVIDGRTVAAGDAVIGVASSGLHSNGYSLVRKIVFEHAGLNVNDHVAELGATVGQELLKPTRIYARVVRRILSYYKVKNVVHGIAHITGGGLRDNAERVVPAGFKLKLEPDSWTVPPVFSWLQKLGEVDAAEMARVFNMGIGLVLIVAPYYANHIQQMLADAGLESWQIGTVEIAD